MHRTSVRFWTLFSRLPEAVSDVARKNFELLKDNPSHASLHFRKVGKLCSVRAGINHRDLAAEEGPGFVRGMQTRDRGGEKGSGLD